MTGESDRDLPLHDEAKARSKWRGETILDGSDLGDSGPASEVDHAARGDGDGSRDSEDALAKDLAQRPPD